jgi:hypothetical protein
MKLFNIDRDNNITAFTKRKDAESANGDAFRSQTELSELAAAWTASRLVEIWNSIPGCVPVKKFTNRKTAILRIWKAIQSLHGGVAHAANPTSDERPATRARNKTRANQTGDPKRTPTEEKAARDSQASEEDAYRRGLRSLHMCIPTNALLDARGPLAAGLVGFLPQDETL